MAWTVWGVMELQRESGGFGGLLGHVREGGSGLSGGGAGGAPWTHPSASVPTSASVCPCSRQSTCGSARDAVLGLLCLRRAEPATRGWVSPATYRAAQAGCWPWRGVAFSYFGLSGLGREDLQKKILRGPALGAERGDFLEGGPGGTRPGLPGSWGLHTCLSALHPSAPRWTGPHT